MSKRLLIVGNFLSGANGSRCVCEELAPRLVGAGWQVTCTSNKAMRLPRIGDMLYTIARRRHQFSVAQVDVYSGAAFRWAEAVCWMLRRYDKPYVLTLHGGNLPHFARRNGRRVTRLLDGAHAVTAPSRFLVEALGPYRPDIRLLPNPLDVSQYPFRKRSNPGPNLVWLRAFEALYNPGMAIRVIAALAPKLPNIQLTMIGPDKGDGSLQAAQQLARELNVSERCTFQGRIEKADVPRWLDRYDLFLNTTGIDNTPVSVIEALACGLDVVSTNVGGIPFLLSHGVDALLVPPNDPQAMADAVFKICTDGDLAATLSTNARVKAEAFDWSSVLAQWDSLLLNTAGVA